MAGLLALFFFFLSHILQTASFTHHLHVSPVKAAYSIYQTTIDASAFTHLFFAFAQLDSTSFSVVPPSDDDGRIAAFSSIARKNNPFLKTLVSIGGGGSDASAFSAMAGSRRSRQAFIASSISFARRYGFDGLDLDWEFPSSEADMANLASLFAEWRTAILAECFDAPLLLTAAVKFNVTILFGGAGTYPVQSISRNLDWINIMSFDYHGSWDPSQTGEHAALYDSNPAQAITTDYGIRQWLAAGLPPARAVLGLAMYGRSWYLRNASEHGVGAPATSAGPNSGVYTYDEVNDFAHNKSNHAVCKDDRITKSAYCYGKLAGGTLWVGYDDRRTIAAKVRYLKAKRLRGYFFWRLGYDKNGDLSKQACVTLAGHAGL